MEVKYPATNFVFSPSNIQRWADKVSEIVNAIQKNGLTAYQVKDLVDRNKNEEKIKKNIEEEIAREFRIKAEVEDLNKELTKMYSEVQKQLDSLNQLSQKLILRPSIM